MKLTQWTLFIDMLGYRDINGSITTDKSAEDFVAFMDMNKELFTLTNRDAVKKIYEDDKSFNLYKYYEISSCFVSDSLIITYKPKLVDEPDNPDLANMHSANALFIITMRLQTFMFHCFAEKGIFLRGGISNKYCYIKDNFAVGEGLIEAYEAESSIAKHPRIILHPDVQQNVEIMKKIDLLAKLMYGGKSILHADPIDGIYFLDHLGYAISTTDRTIPMIAANAIRNPIAFASACQSVDDYVRRHAEAILRKIKSLEDKLQSLEDGSDEKRKTISVLDKFIWLKTYHNNKIPSNSTFVKYVLP